MAVFLVPIIAIVAGGALAAGAGIGVNASRKTKAEKAAELEIAKTTAAALFDETQAHISSGALYPAFRAYRKFIDHVVSHFSVSPHVLQECEDAYNALRNSALNEYRKLHNEYQKEASAVVADEEGGALYKVQHDYITKLEKLLGKEAPKIKTLEDSFGINYRIHKYGFATN